MIATGLAVAAAAGAVIATDVLRRRARAHHPIYVPQGLMHSELRWCVSCGRTRVAGVRADGSTYCWTHAGPTAPTAARNG